MKTNYKDIMWFAEVDKKDIPLVGGKGANLGELTKTGIQVPPGFVVTADSYFRFIEEAGLFSRIGDILKPLNPDNADQLKRVAEEIKGLIGATKMPEALSEGIRRAYQKLGGYVAVRSSATAEDLPEASFAGQQSTFLNIQGEDEVVRAVQMCWASLFESRAIFYRAHNNFDHLKVGIAVPVQRMVQSEISGVMFTVEPVSGNNQIVIEAVFGLGEAVVSGEVIPDLYVLDKESLAIKEKRIARQDWRLVRSQEKARDIADANFKQTIPQEDQEKQKLSDDEIVALAQLGKKIESIYQFPQDIEWAKEGNAIYIVQARPITTLKIVKNKCVTEILNAPILLSGSAASPGLGSGLVRIILNATEVGKIEKGDVLVAEMTTPDFVPAMKRAAGIVTNRGGRTCHAAIVSRELGVPCVVGTGAATTALRSRQLITVDGSQGRVYDGKVASEETTKSNYTKEAVNTRTRLYVNLADPELAEGVASRNVDGVGLLRAEFIVAHIGEHPRHILKEGRGEEFITKLAQGIGAFAKAFSPRPVVYRTTDFKTNEYRNLKGGQDYEELEENPMLGYRGCSRYINEPDVFKLEIEAIKRVRSDFKNLWVMLPFVRTVGELARTKRMLATEGLRQSAEFKLWMMVEIPSNIFLLDKFLDVGIDGISIGSNDLTQLTLGVDRDNQKLADDFDEQDEAVLMALEKAIKTASRKGVTCSICGQAPSTFPELVEKLVGWGITSVSVNPDAIERTRENIAAAEQKLAR